MDSTKWGINSRRVNTLLSDPFEVGAPWLIRGDLHIVMSVRDDHAVMFNPRTLQHRPIAIAELRAENRFMQAAVVAVSEIQDAVETIESLRERVGNLAEAHMKLLQHRDEIAAELERARARITEFEDAAVDEQVEREIITHD